MGHTDAKLDEIRLSCREFVEVHVSPHVDEWESNGAWPVKQLLPELGRQGLLGLGYSKILGGSDLPYQYRQAFGEELGRIDCGGVPMSVSVHTDMSTPALARYGTTSAHQQFLVPAIRGESLGALAISEDHGGSDLSLMQTTVTQRNGSLILEGSKAYVTNGGVADFYVVLCKSREPANVVSSLTLLIVPGRHKGVDSKPYPKKLGNLSCHHARITFDNVPIDPDWIIGEMHLGYGMQVEQLDTERLMLAILHLAQTKRNMRAAKKRGTQRRAFNKPVGQHEMLVTEFVRLESNITLIGDLINRCVAEIDRGAMSSRDVALAKREASKALCESADLLIQIGAGSAYMEDVSAQRAYRDARSSRIAGGTDEILTRLLGMYEVNRGQVQGG